MADDSDKEESVAGRHPSKFTDAAEGFVDQKQFYDLDSQVILGPIYERFDEQLKLLHEQKIAQRNGAERAECFRNSVKQLLNEFPARLNKTENMCEALRKEMDGSCKRINDIERRAILWDSTQDRLESVQAELVSEMCMQLQEKYRNKLDVIEQQLAEQSAELHKLKHMKTNGLNNVQTTPRSFEKGVEEKATVAAVKSRKSNVEFARSSYYDVMDNSRPIQRPMAYSGDSLWESYLAQFEITAQLNGWSDQQKAAFLATSLTGPALNVLSNLPSDRRDDYQTLVSALESRFGTAHRTELSRVRFKNRVKQRDESLAALSDDLERLGRMAYPDASADVQNVLSRDQFVDALPNEDMRLRIKQERPKTLQRALELALELESFQLASKHRYYRTSREAKVDQRSSSNGISLGSGSTTNQDETTRSFVKLIERMEKSMRECLGNVVAAVGVSKKPRNSSKTGCWGCGALGHIRRNCPRSSPSRDMRRGKDHDEDRERTRRDQDEENRNRERVHDWEGGRRDYERDRDGNRKRDLQLRDYGRDHDRVKDFERGYRGERDERKDSRENVNNGDLSTSGNFQKLGSGSGRQQRY